jgi:hypothetical protein
MFSIVTSLYNLTNVRRGDGRKWEDYLEWFGRTLQVKCPFIIFTEEESVEFIKEKRGDLPTHIITTTLEEVPLHHLNSRIQKVLDSSEYIKSMADVDRVECKDSLYSVIQYSKFKWLKESSEINPFDSKYFFWLDAGASRFIDKELYNNVYPCEDALKKLDEIDNCFLLQYNAECYPDLVNSSTLSEDYLLDNRSFICGSMFGGNAESIKCISSKVDQVIEIMLEDGCMNNEQIALGYLCKNNDDLFACFERKNPSQHLALFQEMS